MVLVDRDKLLEKVQYFGDHPTYDDPMADYTAAVTEEDILNADEYTIDEYTLCYKQKTDNGYVLVCDECGYELFAGEEEDISMLKFCPHCGRAIEIRE